MFSTSNLAGLKFSNATHHFHLNLIAELQRYNQKKNEKKYLTESNLGVFLEKKLGGIWIHDKPYLGRFKPDYWNESTMTIVEFDGYAHYTQASRILADKAKDKLYSEAGYKIIRIPYFIQLSRSTCKTMFNIDLNIEQVYPHGFIDKKCILPADFCELGIERFKSDMSRFANEVEEIINSLKTKTAKSKYGVDEVLPKSLKYLLSGARTLFPLLKTQY